MMKQSMFLAGLSHLARADVNSRMEEMFGVVSTDDITNTTAIDTTCGGHFEDTGSSVVSGLKWCVGLLSGAWLLQKWFPMNVETLKQSDPETNNATTGSDHSSTSPRKSPATGSHENVTTKSSAPSSQQNHPGEENAAYEYKYTARAFNYSRDADGGGRYVNYLYYKLKNGIIGKRLMNRPRCEEKFLEPCWLLRLHPNTDTPFFQSLWDNSKQYEIPTEGRIDYEWVARQKRKIPKILKTIERERRRVAGYKYTVRYDHHHRYKYYLKMENGKPIGGRLRGIPDCDGKLLEPCWVVRRHPKNGLPFFESLWDAKRQCEPLIRGRINYSKISDTELEKKLREKVDWAWRVMLTGL